MLYIYLDTYLLSYQLATQNGRKTATGCGHRKRKEGTLKRRNVLNFLCSHRVASCALSVCPTP